MTFSQMLYKQGGSIQWVKVHNVPFQMAVKDWRWCYRAAIKDYFH